MQEVFALYDAHSLNQNCSLPKRHLYQDYIEWLQQQSWKSAEMFWQKTLQGFSAPTQLPTLTQNPQKASASKSLAKPNGFYYPPDLNDLGQTKTTFPRYGCQKTQLSSDLTAALEILAREQQLTLNTLVQGAWVLLLGRYSGETDVIFGATRACRHSSIETVKSMVGLFINTLPIRAQINDSTELLPWLTALRAQWVALRDYEHTPLVKVQEWSDVPGDSSLFESIVIFDNLELSAALQTQGGKWTHREFDLLEQMHYPLVLNAYGGSNLTLKIHFDRQKFEEAAVLRMLGYLETLLQSFVVDPQRRVVDLPLLTAIEQQELFIDWNRTQTAYPQDRCIHHLFEQQAARSPDAIAVTFEEQQLTYRELNERANQLAHYLRLCEVGPDVLVGLHMERSLEMMVGLLGIHKAGGAYLPLDPDFPRDRLAFMLQDSQTSVILTQQKLIPNLSVDRDIRILPIDTLSEDIAQ